MGVDDVTDEEKYNKVEDMTPFAVEADTSILSAEYARHDHNEGTIVKQTIINIPLVEWLCLVIFSVNMLLMIIFDCYGNYQIYYAIKWCIMQLNNLLGN